MKIFKKFMKFAYFGILHLRAACLGVVVLTVAPGNASASCVASGAVVSSHCDADYIQLRGATGFSSLTVSDEVTDYIEILPDSTSETPTSQTLTIGGVTTVSNSSYSAVYSMTTAPEHDLDVYIGNGVTITSVGGFGAVWLRNEVSGDLSVENDGTVTATGGPGITLTTNEGGVSIVNDGSVTSTDNRGIYADGGYNNSSGDPVLVSIVNTGIVDGYTAAVRAVNYQGLASITNSGTVTSTTRQGLVAWAANGGVSIGNSGTVIAEDDIALQAWSTGGDVTVTNSGHLYAYDDTAHADAGSGHDGIFAYAESSGNISITNAVTGTIYTPDGAAITAETDDGDIDIVNAGTVTGLSGIEAVTGGGTIAVTNTGTVTALGGAGVTLSGAGLTNSGRIVASTYGVYLDGSGNSVTTSGSISGDTASIFYSAGGNALNILPGAGFSGVVDYNGTSGNTTTFGAGSYAIPAANYLAAANTITLDNDSQVLILDDSDTTGTINVVAAAPVANMANQYTGSVSDVIGSILALDIDRPSALGSVEPLAYAQTEEATPAAKAIASISEGLQVDGSGNLFWARAFGGQRYQPETDDDLASHAYHYGLIAGADRQFGDLRLGLFAGAGAVSAEFSDHTNALDGRTGFAGVYGSAPVDGVLVNASLTVGAIDNESRRSINGGSEWAEGDFWGWYVSPELSLSKSYDVASGWKLTPNARLRYVGALYDDYDESGSSQNLSYGSHATHSLEGRMQLDLSRQTRLDSGRSAIVTFSGAVVDTQNLGAGGYTASLSNAEFKISDSSARNVVGVSLGAAFDVELKEAMSLYGGVEGTVLSDQSVSYTGRLGLKTLF